MNSPVPRCAASGDSFLMAAEGVEQDGEDRTRMRIGLSRGYAGPGSTQARSMRASK
jgi:hypothetical protein